MSNLNATCSGPVLPELPSPEPGVSVWRCSCGNLHGMRGDRCRQCNLPCWNVDWAAVRSDCNRSWDHRPRRSAWEPSACARHLRDAESADRAGLVRSRDAASGAKGSDFAIEDDVAGSGEGRGLHGCGCGTNVGSGQEEERRYGSGGSQQSQEPRRPVGQLGSTAQIRGGNGREAQE